MNLMQLAGMSDEDESLPLHKKSREELISLVIRLTEMTAQQAQIIGSLRLQISSLTAQLEEAEHLRGLWEAAAKNAGRALKEADAAPVNPTPSALVSPQLPSGMEEIAEKEVDRFTTWLFRRYPVPQVDLEEIKPFFLRAMKQAVEAAQKEKQ